MSELTDRFKTAAAGFDRRVQAVPADQWEAKAPCDGWTARDIVGHVVGNYRGIASQATGGERAEMGTEEDPAAAWSGAYGQLLALANDSEALAKEVQGPTGPTTFEGAIGSFVAMDTNVHTWDLARTVGGDETLDPELVRFTREILEPIDDVIRRPGVFGPKLEAPDGSDEQTQLLYFLGRKA